jgi:hypothetical protein
MLSNLNPLPRVVSADPSVSRANIKQPTGSVRLNWAKCHHQSVSSYTSKNYGCNSIAKFPIGAHWSPFSSHRPPQLWCRHVFIYHEYVWAEFKPRDHLVRYSTANFSNKPIDHDMKTGAESHETQFQGLGPLIVRL